MTRRRESALEMHLNNGIPFFFTHVGQHSVAQDARVVDHSMQITKSFYGGFDQTLSTIP